MDTVISENIIIDDLKLKILGKSRIGTSHIKNDTGNQDSMGYFQEQDNYAFVVADGVGSCRYAREGSHFAAAVIEKILKQILNSEIDINDLESVGKYIVNDWKSRIREDWNEYASTINFAVILKDNILIGKIGDGDVFGFVGDSFYQLATPDEDFYSNVTNALSEYVPKAALHLKIQHRKNGENTIFCLMSDGVSKEINHEKRIEFISYLARKMRDNLSELNSEVDAWFDELDHNNDDDKSILIFLAGE